MWFVFAAAAAMCFGIRGILYQWTSQRPIDRNMLLFGVYLSGSLIAFALNLNLNQAWTYGVWMGIPMGIFSFIANASMYKGFSVGRASMIAMFTGLPPVVVVVVAYFLWGEALGITQLAGFLIVIAGVLVIRYSRDLKLGQLQGLQWGLLTMFFFGLTDISSKQATLFEAATLPLLTVMYGTGAVLFASLFVQAKLKALRNVSQRNASGQARVSGHESATDQQLQVSGVSVGSASIALPAAWTMKRTFIWGMFVGITNIAGMIFIVHAFRDGVTGIVSVISAMNLVIVLLYARFYLKEMISRREALGMLLALAGIVVLRLAS
ncbi:EamA family transporter [Paenibacillus eucommiae]|uniref:Drug/metabolite transporter (DMT)-like permease n=1 Tax=Paenibacillus eucommiae TaxID=1355755 RepID=A0ABS4J777_9BACL|nr:EamA family transporter [Paenibacillus eucommiae]MBP1995125.1 drug/metabolite transporter (DMT)-like permease [Paenibacillus eucommiae]